MSAPVAFELTVGTTYVRLSSARLICDCTVWNTSGTNLAYLSVDGGATRATLGTRAGTSLRGVNLNDVFVAAAGAGTVVAVIGNTR
jgi:hypothetical protein